MNQPMSSSDGGKTWQPAKQIPYTPSWWENLKCAFGFHEPRESKKYEKTTICFRCGKRRPRFYD